MKLLQKKTKLMHVTWSSHEQSIYKHQFLVDYFICLLLVKKKTATDAAAKYQCLSIRSISVFRMQEIHAIIE